MVWFLAAGFDWWVEWGSSSLSKRNDGISSSWIKRKGGFKRLWTYCVYCLNVLQILVCLSGSTNSLKCNLHLCWCNWHCSLRSPKDCGKKESQKVSSVLGVLRESTEIASLIMVVGILINIEQTSLNPFLAFYFTDVLCLIRQWLL